MVMRWSDSDIQSRVGQRWCDSSASSASSNDCRWQWQASWMVMILDPNELNPLGSWSKWIESSGFLVVFILIVLQSVKPARWMSPAPYGLECEATRLIADKLSRICWERDWLLHCSDSVIPATRPASNLQDAVLALRHVPPRPARSAVQPQG